MPRRSLRFSITNGAGRRAASWKVWVQPSTWGQEAYLSCRELGGYLHTSFHPSGEWHTVMTKRATEGLETEGMPGLKPRVEEWPRPAELKPGVVLAYKIITPWTSPATPITGNFSKVIQLPMAPKGKANETFIFISMNGHSLNVSSSRKIGELSINDKDIVTVIDHHIDMPKMPLPITASPRYFVGKSKEDFEADNLRMLLFGDDEKGHRMILDARAMKSCDH